MAGAFCVYGVGAMVVALRTGNSEAKATNRCLTVPINIQINPLFLVQDSQPDQHKTECAPALAIAGQLRSETPFKL